MRALLTGGIKAILAIAALSTAAHWALRVQREPTAPAPAMATLPEPTTTGSIEPRRIERPAAKGVERAPEKAPAAAGLDQTHLAALIADATGAKPKAKPAPNPAPKR
jgi:hypothetical protein